MAKSLKAAYRTVMDDHFPERMEISFDGASGRQTLFYEKVSWVIDGVMKGLRYGENPGQEAAQYRLVNGNLVLGGVESIGPGQWLASDVELLQSGKHPGKTNLTDVDNALNILRYFDRPCAVIVKHNNPCGVALAETLSGAFSKAYMADRIAAFGGAVAFNRPVDLQTAHAVAGSYFEVVAACDYEEGAFAVLSSRKNLRIMRIAAMDKLAGFVGRRFVDFKSLIDGGIIAQWSFVPMTRSPADFLPAIARKDGREFRVSREPTPDEAQDLLFGWLVESGITSNSVIYVKDLATVGIGTGEQDRVGVAEIARDKAYRKMADRICFERHGKPLALLDDPAARRTIDEEVAAARGGLLGARMVSDAFFPFRDGIDVGLREGVSAVIQPGGSDRDWESIEACNEAGAAMVFTGQRSFRH